MKMRSILYCPRRGYALGMYRGQTKMDTEMTLKKRPKLSGKIHYGVFHRAYPRGRRRMLVDQF
jgi:hypothetical protein